MELTIDVIDKEALRLLSGMEHLQLIRLRPRVASKRPVAQPPSERFAGALHLSEAQYEAFQTQLQNGRNEWAKTI
jgi:hypothetical protein